MSVFGVIFEIARHIAVLRALDHQTTVVVDLLPVHIFGLSLRLTNLNVMNGSFATAVVLLVRNIWVRHSTGGRQFMMRTTPVGLRPVDHSTHAVPNRVLAVPSAPAEFAQGTALATAAPPEQPPEQIPDESPMSVPVATVVAPAEVQHDGRRCRSRS